MTKGKVGQSATKSGELPPSYEEATADYEGMYAQFSWDDHVVRRTFIRKVYAILMTQLFVTVAIVALFLFCEPVRFYIQTHPGLYMMSNLTFLSTYIALSCCGDLRRQFPVNIVLLSVFTLSMAVMLGFISSFYDTESVFLCLGITALVCFAVTMFSFQTKYDVTGCHGLIFSLVIVLLLCIVMMSIGVPYGYIPLVHSIYASIGAILFTMFLAFDIKMLLGNGRYAISPEEYVFASLQIYLDIVYLFTFLLQIFGGGRE